MATLTILDIQQINYGQLPSFGQVWVGNAGTDPLDTQVDVYTDYALTNLVSTPLDLDFNGRPLDPDTGEVVTLYTNFSYSIQWTDKNGAPLLPDEVNVDISTGGGGSDGVVTSGALDTSSQLILQRSIGGPVPDIDLSGLNPVPSQVDTIIATGTYNVPAGARFLKVTCRGGGGGGGAGRNPSLVPVTAGGGNSGSKCITYISSPDASYAVTIGAGGLGATNDTSNPGGIGGTTSFGSVCVARGGMGATGQTPGPATTAGNVGDIIEYSDIGGNGIGQVNSPDYFGIWRGGSGGGRGAGRPDIDGLDNTGSGGGGGGFQTPTTALSAGNGGSGVIIVEVY